MAIKSRINDPLLPEIIEKHWFEFFKFYSKTPGFRCYEYENYKRIDSKWNRARWNGIYLANMSQEMIDNVIKESTKYYKKLDIPWTWKVGPASKPDNISELLWKKGLFNTGNSACMAIDLTRLKEVELPEGLSIELVNSSDSLRMWAEVLATVYVNENFIAAQTEIEQALGLNHKQYRRYIGYYNGKPVVTSALLMSLGVAGLYMVSTLPMVRRMGFGTALTIFPLLEAHKLGYKIGVLHSSDSGYSVYQKIGFKEIAMLSFFRPRSRIGKVYHRMKNLFKISSK